MAFTKNVTFVNQVDNAFDGKIVVTVIDTTPGGGPYDVFISIGSPSDPNYYVTSDPVPEIVLSTTGQFTVDIPVISGEYENGTYTVTIEIDGEETNTGTYNYVSNVSPGSSESDAASKEISINCENGTITCSDTTVNTGYTLSVPPRYITIKYPAGSNLDDVESNTVESLSASTGTTNGTYTCIVEIARQKIAQVNNNIIFTVNEIISSTSQVNVSCLYELLKLKCLFVENVRNYVELLSYGIDCDLDNVLSNIKKMYALIKMYGWCDNQDLSCLTTHFINKNYDKCNVTISRCTDKDSLDICEEGNCF